MKKRFIEPVIATSETYRQRIESLGIEFYPLRPDWPAEGHPTPLMHCEIVLPQIHADKR